MAEKHVHKVYGSFPPWGKSVEFPANGSGSGGGGNYVYFDTSSITEVSQKYLMTEQLPCMIKMGIYSEGMRTVISGQCGWVADDFNAIYAIAYNMDLRFVPYIYDESSRVGYYPEECSMEEAIQKICPWVLDLPRITEEEFYKIPTQFTFYDGYTTKTYGYEEGMTWEEWIDSPYNDGKFSVRDADLDEGLLPYVDYEGNIVRMDGGYVKPHMPIQNNLNYSIPDGGGIS